MTHPKTAHPDHAINPLLADRWSPYAFGDRQVALPDLLALLEAARWAASSYNEQPWRYLLACRSDGAPFEQLLSCLVEANQAWAKFAPVLLIGITVNTFERNGKPNKAAAHDLGLASASLTVEATARGLVVHQMVGIDPDRVRTLYQLPPNAEALTALAIGYEGANPNLPLAIAERDRLPRSRRPIDTFVFGGAWGAAWRAQRPI
jgi:nitroreductase